ncbi:MAG TPA: hypothetical protein VLC09_17750 [Polyangiaceae bacterium]|nr:hypothetical protein [Polyangiaceae bacterium]
MKPFAQSFGLLALLAALPVGCSTASTDLPLDNLCVQMGMDRYEFLPVGATPMGSFELDGSGSIAGIDQGALIIDDDDLTDDYPIYQEGQRIYHDLVDNDPALKAAVEAYESSDTTDPPSTVPELTDLVDAITVVCPYYSIFNTTPAKGVAPLFVSCKDRWSESGDGILATWDLAASADPQDQAMAACGTVTGTPNASAINFWGPVSQRTAQVPEDGFDAIDGFTYSGITIPITIPAYRTSQDISEWEGVAFWARNATAEEAVPYGTAAPVLAHPDIRKNVPPNPKPQDGASQVGIMIQTNDTAAFELDGVVAFLPDSECTIEGVDGPCFPTQADYDAFNAPLVDDGTGQLVKYGITDSHGRPADVPQPFCIDYSPIDAPAGEETPYRNQCWDGFRYMREIGNEWTFIFLPFDEMRQAGWGQYAPSFRTTQMRSLSIVTSAFNAVNIVVDEVAYYRKRPVAAAP